MPIASTASAWEDELGSSGDEGGSSSSMGHVLGGCLTASQLAALLQPSSSGAGVQRVLLSTTDRRRLKKIAQHK
jgi:hypothetical protein